MKRILYILFLVSFVSFGQKLGADVIKFDSITSTVRDTYSVPYGEYWLIFNGTTGQFEYTDGSETWQTFGAGGTTYTFGTGLTESSGTVTVTNPFEAADESKLDGITTGATVGADWTTNLTNIPANLDLDGTDDVNLTGNQNINGTKWFLGQIRTGNDGLGEYATNIDNSGLMLRSLNRQRAWYLNNNLGYADTPRDSAEVRIYPTDEFITDRAFYYNYDNYRWEIGESPIITAANASSLGIGGTDDQTLSLSGTDLSIENGNTVDLSGLGGSAEYRNPDIHYVTRATGSDVTNAWFETTAEEEKKTINTSTSSNPSAPNFYEIATFTSTKSAIFRSVLAGGSPLVFTSDDYNIVGSGSSVVDIDAGETDGVIGVYIDSLNIIQISKAPAALPNDVLIDGYFKPYSISQVTGLASSNIETDGFDISWDAATASVGSISNYQYSIDGGTPVAVNGATSASVTGLTEDTAYNVNVRAVDAGGNVGQYSADLEVTTSSSFTPLWAANAATPTPNEVAGAAGFIDASNYSVSTVTSPTTNGTHAIAITRTADGNSSADIGLQFQNLTVGQSYDFTFSIQITSGSPNNNYVRTNVTYAADWTVSDIVEYGTGNSGNWETYTLTMTPAVTNPRMRFNSSALTANTNGMVTLFDNLIITAN